VSAKSEAEEVGGARGSSHGSATVGMMAAAAMMKKARLASLAPEQRQGEIDFSMDAMKTQHQSELEKLSENVSTIMLENARLASICGEEPVLPPSPTPLDVHERSQEQRRLMSAQASGYVQESRQKETVPQKQVAVLLPRNENVTGSFAEAADADPGSPGPQLDPSHVAVDVGSNERHLVTSIAGVVGGDSGSESSPKNRVRYRPRLPKLRFQDSPAYRPRHLETSTNHTDSQELVSPSPTSASPPQTVLGKVDAASRLVSSGPGRADIARARAQAVLQPGITGTGSLRRAPYQAKVPRTQSAVAQKVMMLLDSDTEETSEEEN
jgi:hypothetical protein